MNVLIVHKSPITSASGTGIFNVLHSVLSPFYTVQFITLGSLATQPWTASCALLILPSLGTSPVLLSLSKPVNEIIQEYISIGGRMLGLGLGASLLLHRPTRDLLHLWDPRSGTAIVPETPRDVLLPSSIRLQLPTGALLSGLRPAAVSFEVACAAREVIRGHWDEPIGTTAGVQVPVGSGCAAFWGISPDDIEEVPNMRAFLRYALTSLGLTLPEETSNEPLNPLPIIPTYPLPQFLVHQRGKRHVTETILLRLGLPPAESSGKTGIIKDIADTFHFHIVTPELGARLVAEARESTDAPHHATNDIPRLVLILPPGVLPSRELTPRFDVEKYFAALEEARGDQASAPNSWGLGEALLYGEAVTSTQTMLERNTRFLTSLPAPIVSVASFQLAGRGRGSNIWLSPEGCLQFSALIRAPLGTFPAPRLVFVQYLAGLAVIHACRDKRVLGDDHGARVKLKWPNDIYVELPGGETKKVGGILVNTSFSGGNVDIVVGCGINVCTPAPVTSLSLLSPPGQSLDAETVLALVLTKFEQLWNTFVHGRGSWAPFEDAYLDAWMHSDQLVTVMTIDPPRPVRIVGITHDHGLLRTIPERTGWSKGWRHGAEDEYIDLQPDGNSFDIMAGLIKAKR